MLHRTAPTTKDFPAQWVKSAEVEKPWTTGSEVVWVCAELLSSVEQWKEHRRLAWRPGFKSWLRPVWERLLGFTAMYFTSPLGYLDQVYTTSKPHPPAPDHTGKACCLVPGARQKWRDLLLGLACELSMRLSTCPVLYPFTCQQRLQWRILGPDLDK